MLNNTQQQSGSRKLILLVFLGGSSLAISLLAWLMPNFSWDLPLALWLQSFSNNNLLTVMEAVSYLFGTWRAGILVMIAGIIIWRTMGLLEALFLPLTGLISLLYIPVKLLVNRPRPLPGEVHIFLPATETGFASGHSMFAVMFLGMLAYLIAAHVQNRGWRIFSIVILSLLVLLVGTSRVYLGDHWPSDVIGGYLIGGFFLVLLVWLYEKVKAR